MDLLLAVGNPTRLKSPFTAGTATLPPSVAAVAVWRTELASDRFFSRNLDIGICQVIPIDAHRLVGGVYRAPAGFCSEGSTGGSTAGPAMEEVENHMNDDTLKEIRQEYSTLRVWTIICYHTFLHECGLFSHRVSTMS